MKIGFLGAGKLGGPVALAFENAGHDVLVCDKASWVQEAFESRKWPHLESRVNDLLEDTNIRCVYLEELTQHSDILFIAVQTPHEHKYGGAVPLPDDRKDFDYSALIQAAQEVRQAIISTKREGNPPVVAVISTVLPGTCRRDILPVLGPDVTFIYCPFFAAMGTVVEDVYSPEFVLLGSDREIPEIVYGAFEFLHSAPMMNMSVESAELTKVAYNLIIGSKIVIANTIMEICHSIPNANCDDVTNALKHATDRIVSSKYMTSGMGDGGGCHPRDSIAMSNLSEKLDLSCNIFDDVMRAREEQTAWLADMVVEEAVEANLPVCILGKAYKPHTNLTDGSPGLLAYEFIKDYVQTRHYDPYVDGRAPLECVMRPHVYLIATRHIQFRDYPFPPGSVVIDPFRYIREREGIKLIKVGVGR